MCADCQSVMMGFALQIHLDINHLKCPFTLILHQRKTTDYEDIFNDDQYAVGARHDNGE